MQIADLKEAVTIEALLYHYGWDGISNQGSRSGWESILCPFHDDRNPSASYSIDADRFHCFVCDVSGDILDIVRQVESTEEHQLTIREAMDFIVQNVEV